MNWILLVVLGAIGYGVYYGCVVLCQHLWESVPADHRDRSYSFAKDLPRTIFNVAISAFFLTAIGATFVHFLAFPNFASRLRDATSWGPGVVGWFLGLWVLSFWMSDDPPPPAPRRGRQLKRAPVVESLPSKPDSKPISPGRRGRVIRAFRED